MVAAGGPAVDDRVGSNEDGRLTASQRYLVPAGASLALWALAVTCGPAAVAAPFDFLFGGPPRAARIHRRPQAPRRAAEIPLPVPRPHFAGEPAAGPPAQTLGSKPDAGPAGGAATGDAKAFPPPGTLPHPEAAKPAAPPAEAPLPPEKPPGLTAPSTADRAAAPPKGAPAVDTKATPAPAEAQPSLPTQPPPLPPAKPAGITTPAAAPPAVAPSGATTAFTPRSPDDDPQCPGRLAAHRVAAAPVAIGPQPDARCTVVEPVRLTDLALADGSTVDFPDRPTIACATADAFSFYVRDLLVPLAKGTFGSPIASVWTGPGLECRSRDSIFGAKLSAHGQGLAIDIAQVKLADGRLIEVGDPKTDAETGFETASRAGACGYFHTVLGPGSDAYHRNHWHFDLEVRGAKGDSKYCK